MREKRIIYNPQVIIKTFFKQFITQLAVLYGKSIRGCLLVLKLLIL